MTVSHGVCLSFCARFCSCANLDHEGFEDTVSIESVEKKCVFMMITRASVVIFTILTAISST